MSDVVKAGSSDESLWDACLASLGIPQADLVTSSRFDPARRVYRWGSQIFKVVLSDREPPSGHSRAQTAGGEFTILAGAAGMKGVPEALDFRTTDHCQCIVLRRLEGTSLEAAELTPGRALLVAGRTALLLVRLSLRGISHNDVVPRNLLVTPEGGVSLVDFDQATRERPGHALLRQLLGAHFGSAPIYGSLKTVLKHLLVQHLPAGVARRARKLRGRQTLHAIPDLPPDATDKLVLLRDAWLLAQESDASAPGHRLAYYTLTADGYTFPGERSWHDRWEVLRGITDYRGKRVLELGCNLGLLSCHLLAEQEASASLAVDVDRKILIGAEKVAQAFGVFPEFRQQDLDDPAPWEADLAHFEPDIVFALNVMNWVGDQPRLAKFLGRFREVIYEGHGTYEEEHQRLRSVGFTSITLAHTTERGRAVIHCLKG